MFVRYAALVFTFGERPVLHWLLEPGGFVFLKGVKVVQAPQEEKVCDLLYDFQRVRYAAGPESVPNLVDLVAEFAGNHDSQLLGKKLALPCLR